MGWSTGSYIAEDVFCYIKEHVKDEVALKDLAKKMVEKFCEYDADAWESSMEIMKAQYVKDDFEQAKTVQLECDCGFLINLYEWAVQGFVDSGCPNCGSWHVESSDHFDFRLANALLEREVK